ncbi:MAG: TetR/AcrR family transcriptional regulator [Acidimicrobiales bacterium]|nr:TetR/AcrR family transcriptional regulator [Acidimicrobiales bacterium]
MSLTDQRRSDTRLKIIDHAANAFGQKGYQNTSIAEIEGLSGLRPGSGGLYRHFVSKEEVLLAVIAEYHKRVKNLRHTLSSMEKKSPVDELREVFDALLAFASGEEAMLAIGSDTTGLPKLAVVAIGETWDEAYGIFRDLFERNGIDETSSACMAVGAMGSLYHYFLRLGSWKTTPLNINLYDYLDNWTKFWSLIFDKELQEARSTT